MSNAQAERAISQLYESDSLRSELRDEEASLLLMWGEARLSELAQRDLPDGQFDELAAQFRSLLAAINVCVGKRKTSPSQHLPMMASISSAAEASGYVLTPDDQTMFLKHQNAMTNQDAISELLGLLKPAELPKPPSPKTAEAAVESVVAQAAPEVVQPTPPQPPTMNEPYTESVVTQSAPEVVQPAPTMNELPVESIPPQAVPEAVQPAPPQPPTIIEPSPEIMTPQAAPEIVDNTLPPQPEDLPEMPPHPPQEG